MLNIWTTYKLMTWSFTSFRRIIFSNIEELISDWTDDETRDCCSCDDETRDEILNDRKENASIIIKMKEKFDLRIRRFSDKDDHIIRKSN
jgi:hypothetical protein